VNSCPQCNVLPVPRVVIHHMHHFSAELGERGHGYDSLPTVRNRVLDITESDSDKFLAVLSVQGSVERVWKDEF